MRFLRISQQKGRVRTTQILGQNNRAKRVFFIALQLTLLINQCWVEEITTFKVYKEKWPPFLCEENFRSHENNLNLFEK